ncbi:hypothetical protein [Spirosoma endbachense]|uniref:CRISPR-associated protein Csh1 n=1 Tax=Spirosoma endbachense TaxID=2666025 RepID=A0A6P1VY00_9BACT|nr:hypothetical protein [Spirosoma endbachense]QHV96647.1 hypothetical protein GJR95_17225 [Spirosoma endbachense]
MLKELVQFTQSLKEQEMNTIGVVPKEGLHVVLTLRKEDNQVYWPPGSFEPYVYSKKDKTPSEQLQRCAAWAQAAWMVNTNKCFDLPAKGIHSCSPYCLAFKRESLKGGAKYTDAKTKLPERINAYFAKAIDLLDDESEMQRIEVFKYALNSEEKLDAILNQIPEYESLKDANYIVFYLSEPLEAYQKANTKYLADKLFNTNQFNLSVDEMVYGTSDFFNGFPAKKAYLSHQTASFDIAGRISSVEARALFEFQDIMGRGILPRPLPIFVDRDELKKDAIALFKKGAEDGERIGYKEIIETLNENPRHKDDIGNYYLLFYLAGEIKDFDFVSKFEYSLNDEADKPWKVTDWFSINYQPTVSNVFDFQYSILVSILNNSLVVKTKAGGFQYKFFDDIDAKYCKSDNTYLLVMKYRKAFYDFIYKSKRQAVTQQMFDDILQTSILDDLRLDEIKNNRHTQEYSIRQKLNIWFSLTENFERKHKPIETMANKLQAHRKFIHQLTKNEATIETDEQYAFTVGQVIYYLLTKSKTSDTSYKRLEPFLQQVHAKELNKAIARLFDTYKHETFSSNFRTPFAEVMAYETKASIRDLMPTTLAGIFSQNALFSDKETKEEAETEPTPIEE